MEETQWLIGEQMRVDLQGRQAAATLPPRESVVGAPASADVRAQWAGTVATLAPLLIGAGGAPTLSRPGVGFKRKISPELDVPKSSSNN